MLMIFPKAFSLGFAGKGSHEEADTVSAERWPGGWPEQDMSCADETETSVVLELPDGPLADGSFAS